MTNPNNAVGTNGAFGGRTSVNAFNDVLGTFRSRGILSGWGISASSGMTVNVGGNGTTRDVAVAEDANGNKTTINNISASPIAITLDSAPASNSRYDAIVAYVDKPPVGNATQDNPECCGIIPVTGTAASIPAYPDDGAIRSAITADGASGATAYYAILGYVLVASGTTTITSGMITAGAVANLASGQVDNNALASNAVNTTNIANNAVTSQKIDWTTANITTLITGTAQTGFSINQNNSGFVTLGSNKLVIIDMEIGITTSSGSGEKTIVIFGNNIPLGSKAPQLAATYQLQSTIVQCGSWIRTTTKGLVVYVPASISNGGSFRVTGAYIV